MNKYTYNIHSRHSVRTLIYGAYAVLCHAVAIFFCVRSDAAYTPAYVLAHSYAPMLEYTAMSIVCVLVGAMLLDFTETKKDGQP